MKWNKISKHWLYILCSEKNIWKRYMDIFLVLFLSFDVFCFNIFRMLRELQLDHDFGWLHSKRVPWCQPTLNAWLRGALFNCQKWGQKWGQNFFCQTEKETFSSALKFEKHFKNKIFFCWICCRKRTLFFTDFTLIHLMHEWFCFLSIFEI